LRPTKPLTGRGPTGGMYSHSTSACSLPAIQQPQQETVHQNQLKQQCLLKNGDQTKMSHQCNEHQRFTVYENNTSVTAIQKKISYRQQGPLHKSSSSLVALWSGESYTWLS